MLLKPIKAKELKVGNKFKFQPMQEIWLECIKEETKGYVVFSFQGKEIRLYSTEKVFIECKE